MRRTLLILILATFVMSVTSCYGFATIRKDGPYEGKVIDVETGEPIEGVVILGIWSREIISPGGATHNFYDAQETVTDKHGDFRIEGMGLKILSNVTPMDVLIFKTGYEYESGSWSSLKKYAKKIKWEGSKAIISLKKLKMEDRKRQGSPDFSSKIPGNKMKLMLAEINKDRIERGLTPYQVEGE
jgi:hypothetical protein